MLPKVLLSDETSIASLLISLLDCSMLSPSLHFAPGILMCSSINLFIHLSYLSFLLSTSLVPSLLSTGILLQLCLTCTVGSHEDDSAGRVDTEGDVLEEVVLLLSRVTEGYLGEGDQRGTHIAGISEFESEHRLYVGIRAHRW